MTSKDTKDINKYLLWALALGWLGAHRFYIGKTRSATVMLVASLFAILFGFWTLFYIMLAWALLDAIIGLNNYSEPQKVFHQTRENKIKNEKYNIYMLTAFYRFIEDLPDAFSNGIKSIFSCIIVTVIIAYLVITLGFTHIACYGRDANCRCIVNSISKNMSVIDKARVLLFGADGKELIPYLDFGDAIKCSVAGLGYN